MTDLEFIQRCVKGDSLAWDEFFARYSRLIYNYIFQILNSQAPHVAKENCTADIFQEIFLLLTRDDYQKLKTFKAKNSCSLASWLRQVVVNFTIDYLRRQKLMVSLDEENDQGFSLKELLKDSRILVKEQISQEEILVTLAGCIEALAREEKFFLEMHLEKGLSPDELGKLFRIKRGAVDMRKWRIIESLKQCFRRKGFL